MKKIKFIVCSLLMISCLCACSCNKEEVDTFADVSNPSTTLNTGKGNALTVGDVYQNIRDEQQNEIARLLLNSIISKYIDLTDEDTLYLYTEYLNEKFKATFIDSGSYDYNGKFSEELLVQYLKSEGYQITNDATPQTSYLDAPFTWNYSDYIEKELNYDIYMKILKVKYIIDVKSELIEKNEGRRINYYSISVSSSETQKIREEIEGYVEDLQTNYNADKSDTTLIKNIQDVANDKRNQEIQKIEDNYKKLSTSTDNSYQYLNSFTTCGTVRCSVEEGKQYQIDNVKEYYTSEVVIKGNTSVLYEEARQVLFSSNIEDYLYTLGDYNYLISPIYINDDNQDIHDIILFDNISGSMKYYLVDVDVIDAGSLFEDKAAVAELLLSNISDSTVLDYYFEDSDIEIYDKKIDELFISLYGDYKGE